MFEFLQISGAAYAAIFAVVVMGSTIQGSIGFGLNLVVVPVCAVFAPHALPAAMIIMTLPHTLGTAARESSQIDWRGVGSLTLGRIPGVFLGAAIVHFLDPRALALAIGGFVVIAALMSALSPAVPVTAFSTSLAGFVAGIMGTASSIGGPPVALVYQGEKGPIVRSTLGAAFALGALMSLAALFAAGEVELWQWALGLSLMPAVGLGLVASGFLHAWLDSGWLRPCVIGFSAIAGLMVLAQGLAS